MIETQYLDYVAGVQITIMKQFSWLDSVGFGKNYYIVTFLFISLESRIFKNQFLSKIFNVSPTSFN